MRTTNLQEKLRNNNHNSNMGSAIMNNCILCQIIEGKEAAKVVYENDNVLCFLPKEIEVYGHTVIVPKQHFRDLYDIPKDVLCKLTETLQILTKEYKKRIGATGMNVLHASGKDGQQSVPHFHFHLLPRFKDDGQDAWPNLSKRDYDAQEIWNKLKMTD